jgi:hypothetical protein
MKNINLDLLLVLMLVAAAVWTQFHTADLPVLAALGLVPLLGSVVTTPKKRTKRHVRV